MVIVSHPGRQYSHQLALALENAGLLTGYWTGVPTRPMLNPMVPHSVWSRYFKYDFVDLPAAKVAHNMISPVLRKVAAPFFSSRATTSFTHRFDVLFDLWAARRLRQTHSCRAVIGYESGALFTFREAKRRGLVTILDAASFHHRTQDFLCAHRESTQAHERITRRKDLELDIADYIWCVSELAADSYRKAGIAETRLRTIPLGADIDRFKVKPRLNGASHPFRFAFAGHVSVRKGVDVLFGAFNRVIETYPTTELHVFGNRTSESAILPRGNALFHGAVSQAHFAEQMSEIDCLVLPSRHDSFGMVAVEAMAAGVPVILSDQVGAREAIVDGAHGWIVPVGDVDALARAMSWCVAHTDAVRGMATSVRAQAERFSWFAYHKHVVRTIDDILMLTRTAQLLPRRVG